MQKIKIGHRANFRAKYKCFPQIMFPVRAILRSINFRCTDFITDSADACILVMACVDCARVHLKTLSSLLKVKGSSYTVTRKEVLPKKQGKSICYFYCVTQLTSESCCKLFIANFKHCTFVYFSLLMSFFLLAQKYSMNTGNKNYQTKSSKPLIFMHLH